MALSLKNDGMKMCTVFLQATVVVAPLGCHLVVSMRCMIDLLTAELNMFHVGLDGAGQIVRPDPGQHKKRNGS